MEFSNAKATFGLNCTATPTSTGASGSLLLGSYAQDMDLTEVDGAYSVRAIICDSSSTFSLEWDTGYTGGSTSFVAGTAQVETATIVAASGCTSNGTMSLVVTSAGMTGSPKSVDVALTTAAHTSATLIATAARTALEADTVVAARFTIGGTGANITLTRKPTATYTVPGGTLDLYAANDATLNLAIPSGLGVTAAGTSTNTTAGVVSSGVKIYDGDGKDLEGVTLPTTTILRAIRVDVADKSGIDGIQMTDSFGMSFPLVPGQTFQTATSSTYGNNVGLGDLSFDASSGPIDFTLILGAQTV